jgi:hypothetical protein
MEGEGISLHIEVVMLKIEQTVSMLPSCTVHFNLHKELTPWINEIEATWYTAEIPLTYGILLDLFTDLSR